MHGFSLKFRMNEGTTLEPERDYVYRLKEAATYSVRQGTDYLLMFDLTENDYDRADKILELATQESKKGDHERLARDAENARKSVRGLHLFDWLAYLAD